jgi:hypothetical protein
MALSEGNSWRLKNIEWWGKVLFDLVIMQLQI